MNEKPVSFQRIKSLNYY